MKPYSLERRPKPRSIGGDGRQHQRTYCEVFIRGQIHQSIGCGLPASSTSHICSPWILVGGFSSAIVKTIEFRFSIRLAIFSISGSSSVGRVGFRLHSRPGGEDNGNERGRRCRRGQRRQHLRRRGWAEATYALCEELNLVRSVRRAWCDHPQAECWTPMPGRSHLLWIFQSTVARKL